MQLHRQPTLPAAQRSSQSWRTATRSKIANAIKWTTVAVFAAASLSTPSAATASANTAVLVDGTHMKGAATSGLNFETLAPPTYSLDVMPYPAQTWPISGIDSHTAGYSALIGMNVLNQTVTTALGRIWVIGSSLGSITIDHFLSALPADIPSPDRMSFTVMGDPYRGGILAGFSPGTYLPFLDLIKPGLPDTPYDVTVIQNQYDAIGDFPDQPNVVAVVNAVLGGMLYHNGPSYSAALEQAKSGALTPTSVVTNPLGGTTTTYIAPHELAITTVLNQLGVPAATVDKLDKFFKPYVDAGYSRNDSIAGAPTSSPVPASASRPQAAAARADKPGQQASSRTPNAALTPPAKERQSPGTRDRHTGTAKPQRAD